MQQSRCHRQQVGRQSSSPARRPPRGGALPRRASRAGTAGNAVQSSAMGGGPAKRLSSTYWSVPTASPGAPHSDNNSASSPARCLPTSLKRYAIARSSARLNRKLLLWRLLQQPASLPAESIEDLALQAVVCCECQGMQQHAAREGMIDVAERANGNLMAPRVLMPEAARCRQDRRLVQVSVDSAIRTGELRKIGLDDHPVRELQLHLAVRVRQARDGIDILETLEHLAPRWAWSRSCERVRPAPQPPIALPSAQRMSVSAQQATTPITRSGAFAASASEYAPPVETPTAMKRSIAEVIGDRQPVRNPVRDRAPRLQGRLAVARPIDAD